MKMSGNRRQMNFLTLAVLALNSIVLVSSSGSKITALNDYDDLFKECSRVEFKFRHPEILDAIEKDLENIKRKVSHLAPYLEELLQEIICVSHLSEQYKNNLKKIAVLFYVKHLVKYYAVHAVKLKCLIIEKNNKNLAFRLAILEAMLFYYSYNPNYKDLFKKIKPLYLKKKITGVDDSQKRATVDAVEKALKVVFREMPKEHIKEIMEDTLLSLKKPSNQFAETAGAGSSSEGPSNQAAETAGAGPSSEGPSNQAAEIAGSSSEGPSNQTNTELFDNSVSVINNFISSILPGSIMPPIPEVTINTALLDEKIEEFKLIIPEAVMEGGGSRVNKIIQVLMETQGLDVIEKKKDN